MRGILDRLLHPTLRSAPHDELRAARTTAAIPAVLVGTCLLSMPGMLAADDWVGAAGVSVTASCYLLALGVLRWTGRRQVAAHLVLLAFAATLISFQLRADGVRGASSYWLSVLPLLATLLLGRRGGAIWLGVATLLVSGFVTASLLGYEVPSSPATTTPISAVALLVHAGTFFGIVWAFDVARSQMAEAVAVEHQLAEQARVRADVAHGAVRRVLDAVDQALFTVQRGGRIDTDAISAAGLRWFGAPRPGETVWDWLARSDASTAAWLAVAWAEHEEGILPRELTIEQLPRVLRVGERQYALRWLAIDASSEALVVATDVTDALAAEAKQELQYQTVSLLGRSLRDPDSVLAFLHETDQLVHDVADPRADLGARARALHTLKGNAGVFDLPVLARLCHEMEEERADLEALPEHGAEGLVRSWAVLRASVAPFLSQESTGTVRVARAEIHEVLMSILRDESRDRVAHTIHRWLLEPVRSRLQRAAETARALAARLGRAEPVVHIDDGGVVLPPDLWGPIWLTFGHAVRNAVDHGLEPADLRLALGKPERGQLWLSSLVEGSDVVVCIRDDGAGIDWARVAAKAEARGLPHATKAELEEALFADGLSTRDVASEISGRGVGMGALRHAVRELGGRVEIHSRSGRGTTLEIRVPATIESLRHAA